MLVFALCHRGHVFVIWSVLIIVLLVAYLFIAVDAVRHGTVPVFIAFVYICTVYLAQQHVKKWSVRSGE